MKLSAVQGVLLIALMAISVAVQAAGSRAVSDAPLRIFVQRAFARSPELAAENSSLAAAGQQAIAAGKPLYNPELEFDAENKTGERGAYYGGLSQQLDLANRREARGAAGQARLSAARAQQQALRQRIAIRVLQGLANYHNARRQAALAAESENALKRFFTISQRLHRAGEIGQNDLNLARLALANAIQAQAQAERQLSDAREALAVASRVPQSRWPQLPVASPPQKLLPGEDGVVNGLVLNLPTVRRAGAEAEEAEKQAILARRERRANPTVSARVGRDGFANVIGFNLTVPLFVRNGFKAEAAAAAHQAEAAQFSAADTRNSARLRLIAARNRYQTARQASLRWRALASGHIDDGIELLERLYTSGDLEATTYLTQLREHLDARVAGVQLHSDAWRAWFEWLDASGRWQEWLSASAATTTPDGR